MSEREVGLLCIISQIIEIRFDSLSRRALTNLPSLNYHDPQIRSAKENINPEHRPPLPPRTAFICFSDSSKRKIALELGISEVRVDCVHAVMDAHADILHGLITEIKRNTAACR